MLLLTNKNETQSKDTLQEFSLKERRGLKNVYWGLCWTYLSIWLLLLIAVFQAVIDAEYFSQLDIVQCKFWSNVAMAARGGLLLSGGLLMLSAPRVLKIRKFALLCLLLDGGLLGINVAQWFGFQIEVELIGLRFVSFALYLVFLKNLALALKSSDLTRRCSRVLTKVVFAVACVAIGYFGIEHHAYFGYASYVATLFFGSAVVQYFNTLGKLRKPLRNAYGFA